MSQENVEVVRQLFAAFNRRDLDALAALVHPDFEFVSVLTAVDTGATYRGSSAWTLYFEAMDETWKDWHAEDVQLFDGGDELVVGVFRIVGTGKNSDVPVDRAVGSSTAFGRDNFGACARTSARSRLSKPWGCRSRR